VFVVSDRFSERPEELDGLTVYDIREVGLLGRIRGLRRLGFGRAISTLAAQLEVDVVHGHYLLPYGYWAALARPRQLAIRPWGTDVLIQAPETARDRRRARRAIGAADAVVVNSRASAKAAVGLGADPARIEQIVWYANLRRFGPEHRDPGLRARYGW